MNDTYLKIQTFDGEMISVPRSDLIAHLANNSTTAGVRDPGMEALQSHMSYFDKINDPDIVNIWEDEKYSYHGLLKSGKAAFSLADEPFCSLEFDPLDLSKLSERKPDHVITIENDLGEKIEIKRRNLEERIAIRDADIQWTIISQAFAEEANPAMPADLISLFEEGYTPPSKMLKDALVQNWEEIKDGFYRSCAEFDLSDYLSGDDPEYHKLVSPAAGPGVV